MNAELPGPLDHDSFRTAAGTVFAYGLLLAGMAVLLFGLPTLVFRLFG